MNSGCIELYQKYANYVVSVIMINNRESISNVNLSAVTSVFCNICEKMIKIEIRDRKKNDYTSINVKSQRITMCRSGDF